jgi:pimeloyl-ACP methyl ester carboxylesterase
MRDSSQLAHLAPRRGYIVINPSATDLYTGASWDMTNDPPKLASFLDRAINAFHVDARRVHVGGFSQGAVMTWWFLCNHHDALASVAPIAGTADVACLDDGWKPRVPIFYWAGRTDGSVPIDSSRRTINAIVAQLTLTGGMQIAGDTAYARKHWEGAADMALDYVEHDYAGQILVDGHCVPGGFDTPTFGANNFGLNATTCVLGDIRIAYGELALQWYEDHPRPQP